MKIACIQFDIKWEEPKANFSKVSSLIKEGANKGVRLICLPELFSTGVTMNSLKFAEDINDKTCKFLSTQAKSNGIYLLGSFIEKNENKLPQNTTVVYDTKGELRCKYNKNHVFTYGEEHKAYSNGNGLATFNLDGFNVFPFICYDLRFPEIFRIAIDNGADVFVITANWPNPRKNHWISLLKARAIENQAYVIGVNRVGKALELSFFGCSMIISPEGKIIGEVSDNEEILVGEIRYDNLIYWRKTFNSLKDRRGNYYSTIDVKG